MRSYPFYKHPNIDSFDELISLRASVQADEVAFQFQVKKQLMTKSYRQFKDDVYSLASWFCKQGYKGRKIALLGENSYQWLVTYFAVVLSSNIIVPLDKELPLGEISGVLLQCEAAMLICSEEYFDIAEELKSHEIVPCIINTNELLERPQSVLSYDGPFETDVAAVCAIIFTSGTTGTPKGVMLTQKSMMSSAVNACRNVWIAGGSMLVLPLHHTFAFTTGVLAMLVYGVPVYINSSPRRFSSDLLLFRPQNMFLVPLYVETMYKTIWRTAREQKKEKALRPEGR